MQVLAAFALLGAGLMVAAGCKSAPPLTSEQAQSLIQAKYDAMAPVPFTISVNDLGMQEGVTARYWLGTKRYPNGYWADLKLTPEGQKVIALPGGGDTIQWRPDQPKAPHYSIQVVTVTPLHMKARSLGDIQDMGNNKIVTYTEEVVLTPLPNALQQIAQNPGNDLTSRKTATFALANGAWTLQSVN